MSTPIHPHNVAHPSPQTALSRNRSTLGNRCAWALLATLSLTALPAIAGDLLFQLTSTSYQDFVVIGEILSHHENQLVFEPSRVLLGKRLPKTIRLTAVSPSQVEGLSTGDFAVLSLNKGDSRGRYRLNYDAFKVDSPDPSEAKLLSGPLLGSERLAYNWFINSCGQEHAFSFDYSSENPKISIIRENEPYIIGIQQKGQRENQWERIAEPPACKPVRISWWQSVRQRLGL
jgi:hypothetical protein